MIVLPFRCILVRSPDRPARAIAPVTRLLQSKIPNLKSQIDRLALLY
ncbi:MAG: hypothetical protein JGK12_29490 [Microcoleus sp. PH2017_01_SCD_O_A]|nr:hypothetical protein [Microcoleus sp. PH2017_01_SCD_O_A]MCC3427940.1 hypothetical protein [Microcoleus sp. PH2017_01_SCD_O_A]